MPGRYTKHDVVRSGVTEGLCVAHLGTHFEVTAAAFNILLVLCLVLIIKFLLALLNESKPAEIPKN